jgi:hypothetical protein
MHACGATADASSWLEYVVDVRRWSTDGVLRRLVVGGRAPPPRTARDLRRDEQRIMFGYTCPAGGDQAHPICPPTRYFETHRMAGYGTWYFIRSKLVIRRCVCTRFPHVHKVHTYTYS